jgi:hypothetical protein
MTNNIYGDEFQYTDDYMVTLIAEFRKIRDAGEPVTFTPAMIDFCLRACEGTAYSFESMTQYLVEDGQISPVLAQQWKHAYANHRKD